MSIFDGTEPGQKPPYVWPRDLPRVLMHTPFGAIPVLLSNAGHNNEAWLVFGFFIIYEWVEHLACTDWPHKDIVGAMVAALITSIWILIR